MNIITVVLLVVALVLFVLATIGLPSPARFNLLAAGLVFCVLAALGGTVHAQPQSQADAAREQRAAQREHYDRSAHRRDHYPRWCYSYSRRDYYRERMACGHNDWQCRRAVGRKAERCGLTR